MENLYHYYDETTGPFRNLSDLPPNEAENVLQAIRQQKKGFASQRSLDYLAIRRSLEAKARELFIRKGGRPVRSCPHYMTLGECPWLAEWYPAGRVLQFALADFDLTRSALPTGIYSPPCDIRMGNLIAARFIRRMKSSLSLTNSGCRSNGIPLARKRPKDI